MQRLCQALGAFGYLAHVKGKRRFLEPIPRALATLRALVAEAAALRTDAACRDDSLCPPACPRFAVLLERLTRAA
jgi:hypothetical protein